MIEIKIDNIYKGMLSERNSIYRKLSTKWGDKLGVLLENEEFHLLRETNTSVDVDIFHGFVMDIARKSFAKTIAPNIVSFQPMPAPTSKVFYYDKFVTTGISNTYVQLPDAFINNENYDTSKGSYTTLTGDTVSATETNYLSGTSITVPYSGGEEGLTSLEVKVDSLTLSDAVDSSYSNTSGVTIIGSTLADGGTGTTYDDVTGSFSIITTADSNLGGVRIDFSPKPTVPIVGYSMWYNGAGVSDVSVEFCGSTDGTSWVSLDSRTSQTLINGAYKQFILSSPTTLYSYYATQLTSPTASVQINDFEILTGTSVSGVDADFVISPQTWTEDLFANNEINMIVGVSGVSGTIDVYTQWKDYDGLEASSGMQEVSMTITGTQVTSETRMLRAKWSEELEQDLHAYYKMGIDDEMSDLLASEISTEIDREIIRDLIRIAPYKAEWHYDMYSMSAISGDHFFSGDQRDITGIDLSGVTLDQWAKDSLLTKINEISQIIRANTFTAQADWIVCSSKVGSIVEGMTEFNIEVFGPRPEIIHEVGKLKGRIIVYIDPLLPDNICLIGSNGLDNFDAGYVYAPYVQFELSDFVRDPDNPFVGGRRILSRYGKKVINNKRYGLIYCTFPDDFDPVNAM